MEFRVGEFAGRGRIVVLRPEGKTMRQIPFNYNKVVSNNGALENFFLQPGDIIAIKIDREVVVQCHILVKR